MKIQIDDQIHEFSENTTILEACHQAGINIPSLCYLKDVSCNASCGVCVVEVNDARGLVRSCHTQIREGMVIHTNTRKVQLARKMNVELLLANHPLDCLSCERNLDCELQAMAHQMNITERRFVHTKSNRTQRDTSSLSLVRDPEKCILCGRCVAVCSEMQTVHAIDFSGRGINSRISTFMDLGLGHVACTNCGQCALVCPTGAIVEKSAIREVLADLNNPHKIVIVQTAPAVRVSLSEALGICGQHIVTGKMVAGLRKLGFSKVFDTNFAADLTIVEEGNELLSRINDHGTLPMITSCSPGWIKFIEHFYPELLGHLSSCKSPQQMFGAVAKTFYATRMGIDPRKIVVVSIMPCTAKKYEAKRKEMDSAYQYWEHKMELKEGEYFYDVDHVLTTRELAKLFKASGIDFEKLPDEEYDNPLGKSTGAAILFGATGGVMEAALRSAYELYAGKPLQHIEFQKLRGMEGIKTATIDLPGKRIKVAVAHTLKNARKLLEEIKSGESPYAFIEVMTCPGGCLGGGGQPRPVNEEIRQKRASLIYTADESHIVRKSHENQEVKFLYDNFLGSPNRKLAHDLLHTIYTARGVF